jgi:glutamine amidotransferase
MNFVVSDGHTVVATRYISSRTSEASSLFFSSGTSFDEYEPTAGLYRMTKADKRERIIMIASEPLTFERTDWIEVKTNMMVVITPKVCTHRRGACADDFR